MPRGDSFKRYWEAYRRGEVTLAENHGVRGKDKPTTFRKVTATDKTLAARYHEKTGKSAVGAMANEQGMIDLMMEAASQIEDDETRFSMLSKAQAAQNKFNTTWAPYLEQKLDNIKSDQRLEDKISLDDALNGTIELEDKSDEAPGS